MIAWKSVGFVSTLVAVFLSTAPANAQKVDYNRDVRPILSENCFTCHGPDKNHRKADLRLDIRESAISLGAIKPGDVMQSELIARINSSDPDEVMPPPKVNKTLSHSQKETLKKWVTEGAPYALHWAYTPVVRPAVPPLKNGSKVENPIDAFVRANLESRKIAPSPEADRPTLLRRLSLDLIGLPPTPDEVQAFVDDKDPKAYEKQVTRLLKSPHYGERMAVPWLDVVRYADTVGFHGDQNMNAWPYRDYIIDAFNTNKPFDVFTTEQLAGDLLPNATPEQRAATCFIRLTMMTREGGAQPKEYLAKYAADRVRTVGMAWLGSTFACAECHDHKFDPIKMRDFYSLAAFFGDVKQWGVYADYGYTPNPDLRGYNNDYPFPPEIKIKSPALLRRIAALNEKIAQTVRETKADSVAFSVWLKETAGFLKQNPDGWESPKVTVNRASATPRTKSASKKVLATVETSPPPAFNLAEDGSVTFAGNSATNDEFALGVHTPGRLASIRVELLPDPERNGKLLRGDATEATFRLSAKLRHNDGKTSPLTFRAADADQAAPRYANSFEIVGILGGWKIDASIAGQARQGVWLLAKPLQLTNGDSLIVDLPGNLAAKVRVSSSPIAFADLKHADVTPELRNALSADPPGELAAATYLRSTAWDATAFAKVVALEGQIRDCREGKTPVMVAEALSTPLTTRILPRGNWQDESGPTVTPAVPHFLPQPKTDPNPRLNRLDLAKWLVSPENPLTARVFVNRLWKQFFGNGLSAQVDDLGGQGEWPVHPDLLDWLAVEIRESGWNVKHMVELIVTSQTYRQTSELRPEVREIDPNNRLLSCQSPRRLEAEFVRDNALAIAGTIDLEIGGPPSKPYQPANYYANLQFPDRDYIADSDERQYRRGVYNHWQRTFLHPMLANFDAPSREDCVAARTSANSPQQALTLLNDPEFVEAARAFAILLLNEKANDSARIQKAYEKALARVAKPKEVESLLGFLNKVREAVKAKADDPAKLLHVGNLKTPNGLDPAELAAWTEVCRVILNLHETITRY